MRRVDAAWLVLLGGVSAALHVGKIPPALPVLRDALGVTLVQAGFLLSLVQLAGMTLGLAAGLAADGVGLKRTMVTGLLILTAASLLGGAAQAPGILMLLRAVEGFGFLLATVPAPGLLRRLVEPARMNATLGLWGAYMPFGTAVALLCGPWVMTYVGWRGWWWLLAAPSAAMGLWLYVRLPRDHPRAASDNAGRGDRDGAGRWRQRLLQTLSAPGPWLVATAFAMYSAQWLSVIGFLPTIYGQAGLSAGVAGAATALAALVNMGGNIAAGKLLQRGVRPHSLLYLGFAGMGLGAFLAFADIWGAAADGGAAFAVRYAAVLMFSMVGGLVPGTSFSLAVRLAPGERTVSTTVGWIQQWSSFGQFAAPPVVAWVASAVGGWQWSWLVLGACSLAGAVVAAATGSLLRRKARLRDTVQDAT